MLANIFNKYKFVTKILYSNQLYISWNIKDIQQKLDTEFEFKTREERKKEHIKETTKLNREKYKKFANPEYCTDTYSVSVNDNNSVQDFKSYFELDSTPTTQEQTFTDASTFYRYFEKPPPLPPKQFQHSEEFKRNAKSILCFEPPPFIPDTKIKFNHKPKKQKNGKNILKVPEYKPFYNDKVDDKTSIANDLKCLKDIVSEIKKKPR